jgi:hypothetical protein
VAKTFLFEFDTLSFENGSDIQFMKLFVDVVDAQLFVVIDSKVFKTENVEKTDSLGFVEETRLVNISWLNRFVHYDDQPVEQIVEQLLGKRIFVITSFFISVGLPKDFLSCN